MALEKILQQLLTTAQNFISQQQAVIVSNTRDLIIQPLHTRVIIKQCTSAQKG